MELEQKVQNVMEEKYVPHVIEPSFGLGRILFAIVEHSFRIRDEKRTYISLRPRMAPVKCSLLPLMSTPDLVTCIQKIQADLKKKLVSCKVD